MKQQLKRVSMALLMTMVCFLAFAQKTITGTVKDSQGEAIIGASILEKGTRNGVVTDFDGKKYVKLGSPFKVKEGKWIGAKVGYFNCRSTVSNDAAFLDVDWIKFTK